MRRSSMKCVQESPSRCAGRSAGRPGSNSPIADWPISDLAGIAANSAVCSFPSVEAAVNVVIKTIQLGIPVARIELADAVQMDAINKYSKLNLRVAPTLWLEFHGIESSVKEQAETVQK